MDESGLIKFEDFSNWKSQIVMSDEDRMGMRRPQYAFTEQGVDILKIPATGFTCIDQRLRRWF